MNREELKEFLDEKSWFFNSPAFIDADPISIPHRFSKKEDIEISAFLSASIAWGNRKSIITNAIRMMTIMEDSPYDFVMNHSKKDLARAASFVHRTFNSEDFSYFIKAMKYLYTEKGGMEKIFSDTMKKKENTREAIAVFRTAFFEHDPDVRTQKHVSDPMRGSASKRINMFLRWMVRDDKRGVDFGLWKKIPMSSLSIPLDVHSGNTARKLTLLTRKHDDWKAVDELDVVLRTFDAADPVKYDFALFGLGAIEKF